MVTAITAGIAITVFTSLLHASIFSDAVPFVGILVHYGVQHMTVGMVSILAIEPEIHQCFNLFVPLPRVLLRLLLDCLLGHIL